MYNLFYCTLRLQYSINILFICTGTPKYSFELLYCSGLELNVQYLQGIPVVFYSSELVSFLVVALSRGVVHDFAE